MSRGTWLALGSTMALVACSGAVDPQSLDDAGTSTSDDGGASSTADGGRRDGSTAGGDGGLTQLDGSTVGPGAFACGTTTCQRTSEYCVLESGNGTPEGCEADDGGGPFPSQCTGDPTCDCLSAHMIGSCHCVDMEGGGVGIECAGCYGSPPARLRADGTLARRRSPRSRGARGPRAH